MPVAPMTECDGSGLPIPVSMHASFVWQPHVGAEQVDDEQHHRQGHEDGGR